jgi:AraC-like DNA-binding protein
MTLFDNQGHRFTISGQERSLYICMPTFIRSASLTGYVEIVRDSGLDPHRLMRAAGLSPNCLRDPETRIDVLRASRLLEASAAAGSIPDLGLRMARLRRLSNLGPISILMREEPTARKALETLVRHMRLVNESLITRIETQDDLVVIREEFVLGEAVPVRQAVELAVGVMYRILRELLGPHWEPRRVCFTHSAPPSLASHLRTFGRFIEFDSGFNGIVCAARDLDAHNPSADPGMARYARQYLEGIIVGPDMTTTDKVRRLVHSLLPTGRCTVERIAEQLGIDRRTIHRQLARDDTTFSAVLRSARAELALRYVEGGNLPFSDIARALGFSRLSALSRWFRAEFDCSITAWRRRHGAARTSRSGRRKSHRQH